MKPRRRRTTPPILGWLGARAWIVHQPKGVVGIISPWNHPIHLAFAPLAGIFAAGCRAMIKPSERTPRTSSLISELVARKFAETELTVVLGGPDAGAAFAALPFDHLLFTGSTSTARLVARAAAANLVPVTLELGGKSPVIIGETADLDLAARRIMAGKTVNAGQMCLAPDHVLVPRQFVEAFVERARHAIIDMYPTMRDNPDYTAVIDVRHLQRLQEILADARARGGRLVELNPACEDFTSESSLKLPPTLILNPTDAMLAMREETFGPILPVVACSSFDDAVRFVQARPRPLGVYYFGKNREEEQRVLSIVSGGTTINDVIQHVTMEDLPFGGIGASGMGSYHGEDGFRAFSHAKAIYSQSRLDLGSALRPPYDRRFERILSSLFRE